MAQQWQREIYMGRSLINSPNKIIVILSVSEACKILKEHGIVMGEEHIRAGLIAKVYPFGVAFKMREDSSRYVYEIYKPKLMKWIDEISEEI